MKYKAEWDDNGWWFVWKDVGDKWKVFLPIEGEESDERANTIVRALNGVDVENNYVNMLLERDEKIKQLQDQIKELVNTIIKKDEIIEEERQR